MTRRFSNDPEFCTLIIVPSRWPRNGRAVNSRNVRFLTWEDLDTTYLQGLRFDQIIAMSPPVGEEQSLKWQELERRLVSGGVQFYM